MNGIISAGGGAYGGVSGSGAAGADASTVTRYIKGDAGSGIASVALTSSSGLADTYTITYTDGSASRFTVTNGAKGDTGDAGPAGNGIASVSLVSGTHAAGASDTYKIAFTDGSSATFPVYNGADGTGRGDMLAATYDPAGKASQVASEAELTAHTGNASNPHGVTAAQVGLGNVTNTADADKPVSTAQQTALNAKQNKITASGILKGDGAGGVSAAAAGTDYAAAGHTHAASQITAGTLAGKAQANAAAAAALTDAQVRDIYAGTSDMTSGTTSLATGALYLVYE